jgi:hypothetical protein
MDYASRAMKYFVSVALCSLFAAQTGCAEGEGDPSSLQPGGHVDAHVQPMIDAGMIVDVTPDAAGHPDADTTDAANTTDAPPPPTLHVSAVTGPGQIAHNGTATYTVTLDAAAAAGGQVVMLDSTDTTGSTIGVPSSVTVGAGTTSATFAVSGLAIGGPFDVRAHVGASQQQTTVRVVPALVSIGPAVVNVLAGTMGDVTITLEAAPAVDVTVTLKSGDVSVATLPATVVIPTGSASASVKVTGTDKLGVVQATAQLASASKTMNVRVYAVLLSEILYDVSGADDGWEWIELFNASSDPIDTTGMKIQIANTAGPYVDSFTLPAKTIPAKGCVVIGGPSTGATNYTTASGFQFYLAQAFAPNLGNAGSTSTDPGDGIQLLGAGGGIIDNVIYGANNGDHLTDEDGAVPTATDVGRAATGKTLERTVPGVNGTWIIESAPNPGDCSAINK